MEGFYENLSRIYLSQAHTVRAYDYFNVVYGQHTEPLRREKGEILCPGSKSMHGRDVGAPTSVLTRWQNPYDSCRWNINTFNVVPTALGRNEGIEKRI